MRSDAATTPAPAGPGYPTLLAQGVLYSCAIQLSNVAAALPFLCASLGSMKVASLLFPVFATGIVIGFLTSPVALAHARDRKHLVLAFSAAVMAVLIAVTAVAVAAGTGMVDRLFLVTAGGIGFAKGFAEAAQAELISTKLPQRRTQLVLSQYVLSTVITVGVTLALVPVVAAVTGTSHSVALLWLGALSMIAASLAALRIGPGPIPVAAPILRIGQMMRHAVHSARTQAWFASYLVVQVFFVPVSLGTTFYSLRTTATTDPAQGASLLVLGTSAGLLAGSFIWRKAHQAGGIRAMMLGSAVMATGAAAMCITVQSAPAHTHSILTALIFALTAAADQAVYAAGVEWIGSHASESDRPVLTGFSSAARAGATAIVGIGIGAIATQLQTIWPVVIVLALSALAVVAASRTPARLAI